MEGDFRIQFDIVVSRFITRFLAKKLPSTTTALIDETVNLRQNKNENQIQNLIGYQSNLGS